jgi:DNA modification methylase
MSEVQLSPTPQTERQIMDSKILALLPTHTYEQISEITGRSRGYIYDVALKNNARKTEARITERKVEREARQKASLLELINKTAKYDVLDFLDSIPKDSVDLYFTSPPYNVGKAYGGGGDSDVKAHTYYHGWLMQVISEMERTVKPGGVVAINVGKTLDMNGQLMPISHMIYEDLVKSGLQFENEIVWTIPHGLTPKKRLSDRHETIMIFSKGGARTFNANAVRTPQKQPGKRAYKGPNRGELSGNPYGAHPSDVWSDIVNIRHNHPEKKHGAHPAQFPIDLPKRAILLYTNPGALVCDPFSGSGSTQIACVEAHRNFIGCDLFYEDLREKRLADATADTMSLLTGVTDETVAVWQAEAKRVEHRCLQLDLAA